MQFSPMEPQQGGLARQLTLDASALCAMGASPNSSSVTHGLSVTCGAPPAPGAAPAPPASPFSSAPSDIVSAFGCLKVAVAEQASSAAAAAPRPAASSSTSTAHRPHSPSNSTAPAGPASCDNFANEASTSVCNNSSSMCGAAFRSECLTAAFSGIESQAGTMLASQASVCGPASSNCPAHGVKAVCGKRNKMEDTFAVQPNFFDIPFSPTNDDVVDKLPVRIAVQLEQEGTSPNSSLAISPSTAQSSSEGDPSTACCSCNSSEGGIGDTLHFFGVYDGHGGCQAAEHCAKRLHHHLSEALATVCGCLIADNNQVSVEEGEGESPSEWSGLPSAAARCCVRAQQLVSPAGPLDSSEYQDLLTKNSMDSSNSDHDQQEQERQQAANTSSSQDVDDAASAAGGAASSTSGSERSDRSVSETAVSLSGLLEEALKDAFVRTDAEFANDGCAAMVGSTALVALVGSKKIWLANCGDSRAVLCRAGKAIQLTDDHKPEREDEAERVEKAGGQVLYWNGHRVMGVLAMSRAIGDHGLRPYIIPEPEVSVLNRHEEDEFLLLASDGLWDVMANQEATNLTQRCFKRARDKGASRSAAVRIAAAVLTKAAIDRGSKDNVTVVIVDVKLQGSGEPPASATACGSSSAVAAAAASGTASNAAANEDSEEQKPTPGSCCKQGVHATSEPVTSSCCQAEVVPPCLPTGNLTAIEADNNVH